MEVQYTNTYINIYFNETQSQIIRIVQYYSDFWNKRKYIFHEVHNFIFHNSTRLYLQIFYVQQ